METKTSSGDVPKPVPSQQTNQQKPISFDEALRKALSYNPKKEK